jgi:CDP-glucose 4,6-dehydratase
MLNKNIWGNKKILITGHTGFKGSWLCLWLKRLSANVNGLSLPQPVSSPNLYDTLKLIQSVNDYRGNITDFNFCLETIKEIKPDIIFHLAAQPLVRESYTDPLNTYNTNVIGTANVLEAARTCESIKTIVVITTDKCYENIEQDYAYVETDSLGGHDPYSSSKACAEHVASSYYRSFFKGKGVGLATARAGNVIGGGDWSVDRLIPDAVKAWSKNEKLIIRYPQATRPWQHVLDPLFGYLTMAEHLWNNPSEFSGAWNFGPDQKSVKTVRDTIELSVQAWNNNAEWESSNENHPYEANLLQLESKKAQKLLGWKPRMDFEKSVRETIRWYKEYYSSKQDMLELSLNQILEYENRYIYV